MSADARAACAALLLLWGAADAGAHAFLERAAPRAGSAVRAAPDQVRLWFTERLEPAFSSARVLDGAGQPAHRGESALDPANPRLLTVPVKALPPGTYRVIWRVLSVDGHVTEGEFSFSISP